MIDARLLPVLREILHPPAKYLVDRGIHADQITLVGFALGMLAVPALCMGWCMLGLLFIVVNRICDGLDGMVARMSGSTDRGAFLDIALDFIFYAVIPLGFAVADPGVNALPAALLIASFVGTGASFLAFAAIAAKRGLSAESYPTKGIYYLGGLTEGAETIAFFVIICIWPQYFPIFAYIFAILCFITAGMRILQGWNVLR